MAALPFTFSFGTWPNLESIWKRRSVKQMQKVTSLGFEVSWQKTKVQALGTGVNVQPTITVQGQRVAVVDQFVYLGSVILLSTQSTPDIIHGIRPQRMGLE